MLPIIIGLHDDQREQNTVREKEKTERFSRILTAFVFALQPS